MKIPTDVPFCYDGTHLCMNAAIYVNSIVDQLVKNICGNLTDKNNYRPIALSNITSKVFTHITLLMLEEYLWTTDNQFGIKSELSTDFCIYTLSELI